jgi:dinuclear metal center YbgI/SA1388 family protein
MIVAHHGIIWGGIKSITGPMYKQIKMLIDNDINLYAVHLPLDAHPQLGNNVLLASTVGLTDISPFGEYHGTPIGISGRLPTPLNPEKLAEKWREALGGTPVVLPFGRDLIETVGIVSGGGSSTLSEAIDRGLHCFVTGEGRHENHHAALEAGINLILLGHYHSETIGVKAVGRELEERFGLETIFIDEPTIL